MDACGMYGGMYSGICGAVWWLLWMFLVSDTPAQHPRISAEERDMIITSSGAKESEAVMYTYYFIVILLHSYVVRLSFFMGIKHNIF